MYEELEKKKEQTSKSATTNVFQTKTPRNKGFKFFNEQDNKQSVQLKSIPQSFSNNMPIQMVIFVKGLDGKTRMEEDDYEFKDGEEFDFEAQDEYDTKEREKKIAEGRAKKETERKAAILKAEQEKAEKAKKIREREQGLVGIPRYLTRRDRDFHSTVNSSGLGKAHTIKSTGLVPSGRHDATAADQLDQNSTYKGVSDRISFTGPGATHGQVYGGSYAQVLTVKAKKIARAKAKGKADAQHLDIFTSSQLLNQVKKDQRLSAYVKKDDEYQIKVRQPQTGDLVGIPPRFLVGDDFDDQHDSDSDSESE